MADGKHEFYGKEVTDAIKLAVDTLKVPQEQLDIEVLETGSTGIFGLIRKKAKIRVRVQEQGEEEDTFISGMMEAGKDPAPKKEAPKKRPRKKPVEKKVEKETKSDTPEPDKKEEKSAPAEPVAPVVPSEEEKSSKATEAEAPPEREEVNAGAEIVDEVKNDLTQLIELMGYASTVEIEVKGLALQCNISGEYQTELSGPEGKTLDSIQYLIRKIAARKFNERLRITVDVGNFREQRLDDLKKRAVDLAEKVKQDGRTQVLPALNPSERREIHMVLQEDKEVRSRSVGDGLFKKILIYKPGKTTRPSGGGRKKNGPRGGGRRGRPPRNNKHNSNDE